MGENKIQVTIANRNLVLKTDEDVEYILELSKYVDQKIKEFQDKQVPSLIEAILFATINIADELYKGKKDIEEIETILESQSKNISQHIRQVLPDSG